METLEFYRSFNADKSIEELQYNISKAISKLENLELELDFYSDLLEKPIYKSQMLNLFERLSAFQKEVTTLEENRSQLLKDLKSHSILLKNKIKCQDLACDHFFIKAHDTMELRVVNYQNSLSDFKFKLLTYLKSVLKN
ncbi:hypothetical protein V8G61_03095 [Gaetbulibacter sp. M240]|uniref:hypothetical protein n=1 Tax=Gaetbulibacter sp. M240 TaxID=3126511 RepID=UPI00374F711A